MWNAALSGIKGQLEKRVEVSVVLFAYEVFRDGLRFGCIIVHMGLV